VPMLVSSVEVVTREFEREHARRPSGNGSWAFCTVNPNRRDYLDHVLWERGSYGEAKAKAVARAAAAGVEVLYVCS